MSTVSKEYSPDIISQSFIKQYYEMFAKSPEKLYLFYKDESSFIHGEGHQATEAVQGIQNIQKKIAELYPLPGARVDLSEGSVDAQKSENNGVFVIVSGLVSLEASKAPRPFVQSFFLSCQTAQNAKVAYYVRNSVLRLLGAVSQEETSTQTTQSLPITTPTLAESEPATVSEVNRSFGVEDTTSYLDVHTATDDVVTSSHEGETQKPHVDADAEAEPTSDEHEVVEEAGGDDDEEEENQQEDEPFDEPSADANEGVAKASSEPAAPSIPIPPSPPKSFAEIVKRYATEKPAQTSGAPSAAQVSNGANVVTGQTGGRVKSAPNRKDKYRSEDQTDGGAGTPPTPKSPTPALYINLLPQDITHEELTSVFGVFGKVKGCDLPNARGYGFIEYFEPEAARRALARAEIEPFVIKGQTVKVEERQARGKKERGQGQGQDRDGGRRDRDRDGPRRGGDKDFGRKPEGQTQGTGRDREEGVREGGQARGPRKEGGRGGRGGAGGAGAGGGRSGGLKEDFKGKDGEGSGGAKPKQTPNPNPKK